MSSVLLTGYTLVLVARGTKYNGWKFCLRYSVFLFSKLLMFFTVRDSMATISFVGLKLEKKIAGIVES